MADEASNGQTLHSPEIRGFIQRNYSGLAKEENMSIGLVSGNYRVAVLDRYKVLHTLNIEPKWIDDEKLKMDTLKADANKAVQRMAARPKIDAPKQKPKHHR